MKLSENLKLEIKLHWLWFRTLLPAAVVVVLACNFVPIFADRLPLWGKIFFPALCAVLHYCWWRQGLSPDKKTFTPRIWK